MASMCRDIYLWETPDKSVWHLCVIREYQLNWMRQRHNLFARLGTPYLLISPNANRETCNVFQWLNGFRIYTYLFAVWQWLSLYTSGANISIFSQNKYITGMNWNGMTSSAHVCTCLHMTKSLFQVLIRMKPIPVAATLNLLHSHLYRVTFFQLRTVKF